MLEVVNEKVADPDSFLGLIKCVLVSVHLREYSTVLHLEFAHDLHLLHAVGDALLLQVELVHRQVLQSLLDALRALFKHLHLLVAESHVMEQDEQVKPVSSAQVKINHVHNPISFLEEIKCFLILFSFDKLNARIIELGEHDWYFVLGYSQLFVVMLVKCIVLVEGTSGSILALTARAVGFLNSVPRVSRSHCPFCSSSKILVSIILFLKVSLKHLNVFAENISIHLIFPFHKQLS